MGSYKHFSMILTIFLYVKGSVASQFRDYYLNKMTSQSLKSGLAWNFNEHTTLNWLIDKREHPDHDLKQLSKRVNLLIDIASVFKNHIELCMFNCSLGVIIFGFIFLGWCQLRICQNHPNLLTAVWMHLIIKSKTDNVGL